jgi:hypothetical protein
MAVSNASSETMARSSGSDVSLRPKSRSAGAALNSASIRSGWRRKTIASSLPTDSWKPSDAGAGCGPSADPVGSQRRLLDCASVGSQMIGPMGSSVAMWVASEASSISTRGPRRLPSWSAGSRPSREAEGG